MSLNNHTFAESEEDAKSKSIPSLFDLKERLSGLLLTA